MFDAGKTRMIGLPYGEKNYDDMLSRFHLIPERYGQTCVVCELVKPFRDRVLMYRRSGLTDEGLQATISAS